MQSALSCCTTLWLGQHSKKQPQTQNSPGQRDRGCFAFGFGVRSLPLNQHAQVLHLLAALEAHEVHARGQVGGVDGDFAQLGGL